MAEGVFGQLVASLAMGYAAGFAITRGADGGDGGSRRPSAEVSSRSSGGVYDPTMEGL